MTTTEELMQLVDEYAEAECQSTRRSHVDPSIERAVLRAAVESLVSDAERYRLLAPRFLAADFAYGDPPTCAIVFEWPTDARVSADLDASIDAVRAALKAGQP